MSGAAPRWWAITGAPGSGKTTLLEQLAAEGYRTQPEIARQLIDTALASGLSPKEARGDERDFHQRVAAAKVRRDLALPRSELIVFDRGLPDTVAFGALHGWPAPPAVVRALGTPLYAGALLLEPLAVRSDYARAEFEDEEFGRRLDSLLGAAYDELSIPVHRLPPASRAERLARAVAIIGAPTRPGT